MFTVEGFLAALMFFGATGAIYGYIIACAIFIENTFLSLSLVIIPMFLALAWFASQ